MHHFPSTNTMVTMSNVFVNIRGSGVIPESVQHKLIS